MSIFTFFKNQRIHYYNFDPKVFFSKQNGNLRRNLLSLLFFLICAIFFAPNSQSLTGRFCIYLQITTYNSIFFEKIASNPKLKSDFGNCWVDFCQFWSILVNLTEKTRSSSQKVKNISMSKNYVKTALRPVFKEL